jgi:hypothetical protein
MSSLIFAIPEMDKICVVKDLSYKCVKEKKHHFDICYPINYDKEKFYPTVILVSGGSGDTLKLNENFREGFISWGKLLATSGLLTLHFIWNYKCSEDITDFIAFVRENSDKFNIDKDRIATFSFSRGVNLSIDNILESNSGFLKGMVIYYGKMPNSLRNEFKTNLPPIFIAMAGNDKFFSPDCNDKFIDKYGNATIIQKMIHETGEHAFDIRNNDERSIELIKKTVEFLNNVLTLNQTPTV